MLGVDGDADVDAQRQQDALGLERRVEAGDEQAGGPDDLVRLATSGMTMANCSPPRRASRAVSGSRPLIRAQAWISRPSALRCPKASTTWLNESRSTTISPAGPGS